MPTAARLEILFLADCDVSHRSFEHALTNCLGGDRKIMAQQATKIRAVALPAEHGGWALIIEPISGGISGGTFANWVIYRFGSSCLFSRTTPTKSRLG